MMRDAQELATDRMVLGRLSFVRCEDWKCLQEPLSSAAPHSSQSPRFSSARQFLLSCLGSRRNMSKRRPSPPMPRMGRFTGHFRRGPSMPTRSRSCKSARLDAMGLLRFQRVLQFSARTLYQCGNSRLGLQLMSHRRGMWFQEHKHPQVCEDSERRAYQ